MSAIWARLKRVWSRDEEDDKKTLVNEPGECQLCIYLSARGGDFEHQALFAPNK